MKAARFALTFLLTLAVTTEARGATPSNQQAAQSAYLAARNAAIVKVKKHDADGGSTLDGDELNVRLMRGMDTKLRLAIGTVAIQGFKGPGKANIETLSSGDIGFGALDALVFRSRDDKTSLFVTTEGLLKTWLKDHERWWENEQPLPQKPADALERDAFFTQAISADAAMVLYARLPVVAHPDATLALAQLEASTQDQPPALPDEIVVSVIHDRKLFIVVAPLGLPFTLDPACAATSRAFAKTADDLTKAQESAATKGKPDTDAAADAFTRLQKTAADASLRCFADHAGTQAAYAAATKQAQALIDLVSEE